MSETASQWLTVSQAAARLGVSERTVQRRCKSGKLAAKLESGEEGTAWLVDGSKLPTGADTQNTSESRQSVVSVPTGAANVPTGADSGLLEHLRVENAFLRGLVEQRDRDAAELRAALREALRMSNRALMPAASDESASAADAPQQTQTTKAGNQSKPAAIAAQRAAERPTERDARPLWKVILGVR
jgi:hypothetical protein